MNLKELYSQTSVSEHSNIIVLGDRVYVKTEEGLEEYILMPEGNLRLLRSDKENPVRQDLIKIKTKLGI